MGLYLFLLLCLSNLHSYCLVAQSHQLFTTPWTAACQASLSITNSHSFLRLMSIESVMPSNHLIPCHPLLLLLSIFPSIRVFSSKSALRIKWQASASVLPMNIQGWFPLGLTVLAVWSPCCPRDCQESSQAPQLKNISSSAFSLLYDPTPTSRHDYWKNHSFD